MNTTTNSTAIVTETRFRVDAYPCDTALHLFGKFEMTPELEKALLEAGFADERSEVGRTWKWSTFNFNPENERFYAHLNVYVGRTGVGMSERRKMETIKELILQHG